MSQASNHNYTKNNIRDLLIKPLLYHFIIEKSLVSLQSYYYDYRYTIKQQKRNTMNKNKNNSSPLILVGLTILFLIGLSFLPKDITVAGYDIKPVDLFMDIKPDSLLDYSEDKTDVMNNEFLSASVNLTLVQNLFSEKINLNNIAFSSIPPASEITGNVSQMSFYYNALKQAKTKSVRIAHFADSGNEGDYITADVRRAFQTKFGGNGVGFMSITGQDINFRKTTKQSFSDDWKTISVLTTNPDKKPLGISGFVAIPKSGSWVKYETTPHYNYLEKYKTVRLFYSNAKASSIKYSFDNESDKTVQLKPGTGVQELVLTPSSGSASSVKITTTMDDQASFFGVSLESSPNGVFIDNFPLRGNTGVSIKDIPDNIMNDFNRIFDYKLIILQFGLNMAGSKNYNWYEQAMTKMIKDLKKNFPQTSILLVGVGDKGVKRGSKFMTDPSVPLILEAQKRIAASADVAFWNIYDSMGGENAIERWVNSNPPLALKDYVHLTTEGYKKLAELMTEALLKSYK